MKTVRNIALAVTALALMWISAGCDLFGSGSEDDYSQVQYIIGRGYDVFDPYADPQYIRSAVLDYDALAAAGEIEMTSLERTEYGTVSGSSTASYQTDLGTSVSLSGDYPYFSGSVGTSFSSSTTSNTDNQYATIQVKVQKNKFALKEMLDPSSLAAFLTESFSEDIDDTEIDPVELFKMYGTHVMVAVILGARYDYNMAATQNTTSTSTTIAGYAQAAFSSITTEASFDTSNVDTSAFSTSETKVTAVGGDSSLAAGTAEAFTDWRDSITDETVVFSDFAPNGLIPIWEFCADQTRAEAIETAYEAWAQTKYEEYVSDPSTVAMGTATFSLLSFYNDSVGDGGATARWLYKVLLYSDIDGNTDHRLSRARTDSDDSIACGKGDSLTGFNTSYSFSVPLTGSNTFQILPLLEEEDGADLGISGSDNDRFCTALSGPRFNFRIQDQKLVFTGTDTGTNHYSEGYFSFDSGGMLDSSLSLAQGKSKTFYLVLKQFNGVSPEEWVQWKLTVSWN